jgi:hypothetical protein
MGMALNVIAVVACLACGASGFSVGFTKSVHIPTARAAVRCPRANLSLRYARKTRGGRILLDDLSLPARDLGR